MQQIQMERPKRKRRNSEHLCDEQHIGPAEAPEHLPDLKRELARILGEIDLVLEEARKDG